MKKKYYLLLSIGCLTAGLLNFAKYLELEKQENIKKLNKLNKRARWGKLST